MSPLQADWANNIPPGRVGLVPSHGSACQVPWRRACRRRLVSFSSVYSGIPSTAAPAWTAACTHTPIALEDRRSIRAMQGRIAAQAELCMAKPSSLTIGMPACTRERKGWYQDGGSAAPRPCPARHSRSAAVRASTLALSFSSLHQSSVCQERRSKYFALVGDPSKAEECTSSPARILRCAFLKIAC